MNIQLLYRLAKHLSFYKKDLIIVMVSLLSVSASLLLIGSIFRNLVDNGLSQNLISSINKSILYICVLVVILSVASFFRSYFINNVAEKVASRIKKEAYSNLINYEIAEFEEIKIGDIISRLTHDIDQIAKLIVNILSFFIRNFVMLIGGIFLMFFESFKLASIVIITIPLLLFPIIKFGKHVKALSKKALEAKSLLASDIDESFYNIKAIYAFNNQANRITNFNNHLQGYLSSSADRLKIRALFFAFSMALIFLSVTLVIWIGASDIVKGHLSAGQIISFIYYAIIAGFSSGGIFELLSEIHLPLAALERIFKITDKSPIACGNYLAIRSTDSISLEFKDVSFTYHSRPHLKILNNLSFKIDSRRLSKLAYREEFKEDTSLQTAAYINVREDEGLGSTSKLPLEVEFRKMSSNRFIGIVGRSGSGKSTLIQLLLRFYNQDSGQIFINNQDIAFLNPFEVRKLISYVPQEASIFSGTIKSNILFGNTEISEKEIAEITKITGIDEFASKTLQGINTEIGEKGVRLSGGQKQRIALARALLRKPDILLLDEAMSAIDSESEHQLLESIKEIMKGKIIISIAHRISSIESADNILIIDKGELVAEGSHNNLLKNSEFYRTLCREQLT